MELLRGCSALLRRANSSRSHQRSRGMFAILASLQVMNYENPAHVREGAWAVFVSSGDDLWDWEGALILTCGRSWLFCRLRSSPAAATPGWGRLRPGESSCSTADTESQRRIFNCQSEVSCTTISHHSDGHYSGLNLTFSKGLGEVGFFACLEVVPLKGEDCDSGHWPPACTFNQTTFFIATIFHCSESLPHMNTKYVYSGWGSKEDSHSLLWKCL